jgi:hypothetical protein
MVGRQGGAEETPLEWGVFLFSSFKSFFGAALGLELRS